MSMVSSYGLLIRAPPLARTPIMPMRPGKQVPPTAAALPRVVVLRKQSRSRAPLFVCHAESNKLTYNIQPFALVHPKFPPTSHEYWTITEESDQINLWFFVGRRTTKDKLEVATEDGVLVIRYAGDSKDDNPASLLDVRLLIPHGYDKNKVKAEFASDGSLHVAVTKSSKDETSKKIAIGDKPATPLPPTPRQENR